MSKKGKKKRQILYNHKTVVPLKDAFTEIIFAKQKKKTKNKKQKF